MLTLIFIRTKSAGWDKAVTKKEKKKRISGEIVCSGDWEKIWRLIDKIKCGTSHEKVQIEVEVDRVGEYTIV